MRCIPRGHGPQDVGNLNPTTVAHRFTQYLGMSSGIRVKRGTIQTLSCMGHMHCSDMIKQAHLVTKSIEIKLP